MSHVELDNCGTPRQLGFPFPEGYWESWLPGMPAGPTFLRLPTYEEATYMKFAVCLSCSDVISAGVPTDEDKEANRLNLHKCSCKAVSFAYTTDYPESRYVVVSGPANLLAVLDSEWEAATQPGGADRRLFITFMTVPRNATTIIDMDVDPDAPPPDGLPTHYNVSTKAPIIILAQTDRQVTLKYVNTGVQHNVDRLKFYENYAELPGEETT